MTILEQIIKASTTPQKFNQPLNYPVSLNANLVLSKLQIDPQNPNPNPNSFSLLNPLKSFQISSNDYQFINFNSKFFRALKKKLKNPQSFDSTEFVEILNPYLEKIGEIQFGGLGDLEMGNGNGNDNDDYTCKLIVKFGSFIGSDVMRLVIEGCFLVENWMILQTLIENKLVEYVYRSYLLCNLVAKRRSDLICLCVKHFSDIKVSDLCSVLRYFLSPSKEALVTMYDVRKEWKSEALLAIKKASDTKLSGKNVGLAKDAALLLMIAYDGFSSWELCLHYLVSGSVDDVVFSSAISTLSVGEMLGLVRYLGKWLCKYERFPQVGPCVEADTVLGMKLLRWVPRVEDVVKCLGLVVDEHFTPLAMHSEFCDEVKAIEEVVSSLTLEGRLCSSVANLIGILKPELKAT